MLTKDSRRRHGLHGPHGIAPAISATIAVVIWAGLVAPVRGDEGVAATPYDPAALAEIAVDVLMSGATSRDDSVPEETRPLGAAAAETAVASEPDPDSPALRHDPRQRGHQRPDSAACPRRRRTTAPTAETAGYQSNSWRQAARTPRARSASRRASSPRSSGLDPALKAHADGLRAAGPPVRVRLPPAAGPAERGAREEAGAASASSSSVPTTTTTRPACRSRRSRRSPRCPRSSGSG